MTVIGRFSGPYECFSNFSEHAVNVFGFDFPTAEHAFVYAKNPDAWLPAWLDRTPGQVKRLGRRIELRPNWEDIKLDCMTAIVGRKFAQHKDIAGILLDTGIATLIEGNYWHDVFWGMCNGHCKSGPHALYGDNELGCILMDVRNDLRPN